MKYLDLIKDNDSTKAEIILPNLPQEPGDMIDGTEDDITKLERANPAQVASKVGSDTPHPAVAAVVRAVQKATAKKQKREPMAETTSKAELIRIEIAARKAAGETKIRPRDIVAALEARGVTVHAPQVSVALRDAGDTKKKAVAPKAEKTDKNNKRATAKVKPPAPLAVPVKTAEPSYADLNAVAGFVNAHGGVAGTRALLNAYEQLLNLPK
jgi:hypothetical protein